MLPAAGIAPSRNADVVKDVINHYAATVCIHEPTLLANCADHSRRKAGELPGRLAAAAGRIGVR